MSKPSPIREHPPCESCGSPMTRYDHEGASHFWTRRNCGNCTHASVNRARHDDTDERHQAATGRICPSCGAEMVCKPGENICKFEARQTCGGLLCVNKARGSGQRKTPKERRMALDDDLTKWGDGFGAHNLRFRDA